jgi:catechol 2,3-dioxygenase-like lactoylglutathione lyase family enzyme
MEMTGKTRFLTLIASLGLGLATAPACAADAPLNHFLVGISVKNLDAETSWYVEKLGFKVVKDISVGNGRVFFRWLTQGNERLELVYSPTATDTTPVRGKPLGHVALHGLAHIALETADLEATKAALIAKGVPLAVDITEVKDLGIKAIYVTDPEGNAVEIIQRVAG